MKRRSGDWFLVVSGTLGLVGLAALAYRLAQGMKVTWLSTSVPWGMWVAFYIYFIGLSAGSFLFSTLIYVFGQTNLEKVGRMALVSAVLALLAGLLFVWIDLGHPERVLNVILHWNATSVLAWEILFYLFYIACVFGELWYLMRCDLPIFRDSSRGLPRALYSLLAFGWRCPATRDEFEACHRHSLRITAVLGAIGIPLAIGVHGGTGAIFAVVKARPYWYSPIVPVIFLVSALVSGAGLMTFLYAFFGDRKDPDHPRIVRDLARWLVLFLGVDLLLIAAEVLVGLYGGIPDHAIVWRTILAGPYWYVFWVGQVLLMTAAPLALYLFARHSTPALGVAGAAVVVGVVAVRFNLVIPAFVAPPIPGLSDAWHGLRYDFAYFPSPLEWLSSVGLISLIVFLFSLAYRVLPLFALPHFDQPAAEEAS